MPDATPPNSAGAGRLPEVRQPTAREWASRALAEGLVQPDSRSCGAATLVLSRMLHDAPYAQLIATGRHPITGWEIPGSTRQRFQSEALGMHRRATRVVTVNERLQIPWPRVLGTPPWALAAQMSGKYGSGLGGEYVVRSAPLFDRADLYDEALTALVDGHTMPLVVGDRWLPRHVVLAVVGTADYLRAYDPAVGGVRTLSRSEFIRHQMPFGRWSRCWATITPKLS